MSLVGCLYNRVRLNSVYEYQIGLEEKIVPFFYSHLLHESVVSRKLSAVQYMVDGFLYRMTECTGFY